MMRNPSHFYGVSFESFPQSRGPHGRDSIRSTSAHGTRRRALARLLPATRVREDVLRSPAECALRGHSAWKLRVASAAPRSAGMDLPGGSPDYAFCRG